MGIFLETVLEPKRERQNEAECSRGGQEAARMRKDLDPAWSSPPLYRFLTEIFAGCPAEKDLRRPLAASLAAGAGGYRGDQRGGCTLGRLPVLNQLGTILSILPPLGRILHHSGFRESGETLLGRFWRNSGARFGANFGLILGPMEGHFWGPV